MRAYWPFVLLFAFNKPLARYILKKLSQIFPRSRIDPGKSGIFTSSALRMLFQVNNSQTVNHCLVDFSIHVFIKILQRHCYNMFTLC